MPLSLKPFDQAAFNVGMKAKILQFSPSSWFGTLVSMLNAAAEQDIYNVEQSTAYLEETNTS